jgi:hypothetical protein
VGAGATTGAGGPVGTAAAGDGATQRGVQNPQTLTHTPNNQPLHLNPAAFAQPPTSQNAPVLPTPGEALGLLNPPVSFQDLGRQHVLVGQQDELRRLMIRQEEMQKHLQAELDLIKNNTASKDTEMRQLQTSMGQMQNENERLKDENESKYGQRQVDLVEQYYMDVLGSSPSTNLAVNSNERPRLPTAQIPSTCSLLDLNDAPPSQPALEGTLVLLQTMYARPLEFSDYTQVTDLFGTRPTTRLSREVSPFTSLGLDLSNVEHVFLSECYLKFHTDPSFCPNGVMDTNSTVVSLPPEKAFPPRASVLKQIPRKFRKMFLTQEGTSQVSSIGNRNLNLKEGGGLTASDKLPTAVHTLLNRFLSGSAYKNPAVPMSSQFLTFLQHGLISLDDVLLRYESPVYKACPLRVRTYKNGKREVLKNTEHPIYDKWDSLLRRTQFDDSYATTGVTFLWKGFYLPRGKVNSIKDKYAFFAFVYWTDLVLGALPLWSLPMSSHFQLDRKDPLRHYTLDNIRWLNKSDNVANKPSNGKQSGTFFKSTKDVVRLLHNCERANILQIKMLAALTKGYGT